MCDLEYSAEKLESKCKEADEEGGQQQRLFSLAYTAFLGIRLIDLLRAPHFKRVN